jgi:hypothetical protein
MKPLRARAWLLVFILLVAIRFLTIAPDPWHWDEVLLTDAVTHGIDLREHRPHPPGYPLLIESASLLHRAGIDAYRSLAIVGTTGGLLAAGALAALLAAAGLETDFACLGGLLYAFFPSIWLYGVRGFSDAPAAAFYFASCASFLGSARRGRPAGIALGLVLAAVTAGLRPQCAIPLLPIALVSSIPFFRAHEKRARAALLVLSGALSASLLSLAIWWPAVSSSGGMDRFREQLAIQAANVRGNSLLSPSELVSSEIWRRWLVDPLGSDAVFWVAAALSIVALLLRFRVSARILLVILPWAVLNVPVSPLFDAPRYGAVLLGGVAGLTAVGLEPISRRFRTAVSLLAIALIGACAVIAVGPLVEVAVTSSPSCAAIRLLGTEPYARGTVVHDSTLREHVERLLPGRPRGEIVGDRPVVAAAGDVLLVADRHVAGLSSLRRFAFSNGALLRLTRGTLLNVEVGLVTRELSVGLRPAPRNAEVIRYDVDIPVSIDSPSDGAALAGDLAIEGWCQLRGGASVEPVEFRLDGVPVRVPSLTRFPRPDVASVIPAIGDVSQAGYKARLDPSALSPGPHVLGVTFRAADGRRRISQPVRFVWSP